MSKRFLVLPLLAAISLSSHAWAGDTTAPRDEPPNRGPEHRRIHIDKQPRVIMLVQFGRNPPLVVCSEGIARSPSGAPILLLKGRDLATPALVSAGTSVP